MVCNNFQPLILVGVGQHLIALMIMNAVVETIFGHDEITSFITQLKYICTDCCQTVIAMIIKYYSNKAHVFFTLQQFFNSD